jgi:hypothetical protein
MHMGWLVDSQQHLAATYILETNCVSRAVFSRRFFGNKLHYWERVREFSYILYMYVFLMLNNWRHSNKWNIIV